MGPHSPAADGPTSARPRPALEEVLRALREERNVSQEGWSARLGVSRKTVQRWETGAVTPDLVAERELIAYCRERALFQTYDHGPLRGLSLTPEWLSELLAEGRQRAPRRGRPPRPIPSAAHNAVEGAGAHGPARGNLSVPLTSFVGRAEELGALARLVEAERLVTLSGAGGVGKTRLALELGRTAREAFPDGVWLVELAALTDPALVATAAAAACGVAESASRTSAERLIEWLCDRRALLVLDNCEHLVAASAALAVALLGACPGLRVLATSRQPLGVPGEHLWRVPPLSLPDPDALPDVALARSEAGQLFIARARAARADTTLPSGSAAAVVAICRRLDGIPLALELAAARTRALTVTQIAARLEESVRSIGGGASASRHQTITAAIDWSHDLLSTEERTLFWRLAIFAGGFTLEAAEAVCREREQGTGNREQSPPPVPVPSHEVLDILVSLVDKSLVVMEPARYGEAWYRLLEPLRQYAAEKLTDSGETVWLGERHRDWYLVLVEERANPGLKGRDQAAWLARLDQEKDNLRAALRWTAANGPAEVALRLASAAADYWQMRGSFIEGLGWIETALAAPESRRADPRRLVDALNGGAILGIRFGAYARARALLEEALVAARAIEDPLLTARTLNQLGIVARDQGDLAGAQAAWDACLSVFEDLDERRGTAVAHNNLCLIMLDRGQYDLAQTHGEAALALNRARVDERGVSIALHHLGQIAMERDDLARAAALHEEALAVRRRLEVAYLLAGSLAALGTLAALRDDFGRAEALFEESLALGRDHGSRPGQAQTLHAYGQAALDQGDTRAAALLEESLSLARELGDRFATIQALAALSHLARQNGNPEEAESLAEESLALAREVGFPKGIAGALLALAAARAARGADRRAAACHREALVEARELGSVRVTAACFEGLAALYVSAEPERAARLLGTAAALRERIGAPLPPRDRPARERLIATLKTTLGEDMLAGAEAAGRTTPLQTATEEALMASG